MNQTLQLVGFTSTVYCMLDIVASYNCTQFQGKRMIQPQENDKIPHCKPDLGPLGQNSGRQKFFSKIWFHQSISSCTISGKTHDSILRKFSEGRTDRRTDRETDESDIIGDSLTNIKHPTCLS